MRKNRILIWARASLYYFGIAKFLKEKCDCDLFYIADDNHLSKTFFEKQDIVDFKKVWSYNDYIFINKKNVNLAYLNEFENKYKINLWNLAFKDRNFYGYNQYYKFSEEKILSILEYECKFFEKIIEESNPDYLLILPTAYHQDQLLLELCKAKGIKILTFFTTRIGRRSVIAEEFDKINYKNKIEIGSIPPNLEFTNLQYLLKSFAQQLKGLQKTFRQASFFERVSASIRFLLTFNQYKKYYPNYGKTPVRFLLKEAIILLKKKFRENFLDKNALRHIPSEQPFIYFPLHFEPERTLLMPAPFYMNQLEVVTQIAKSIPVGYMLYVKEHPLMRNLGWRSIKFYKNIKVLPNVRLIHPFAEIEILFKKCSLVITIAGTGGMEAAFYAKPSIVFIETSYSNQLPSVYKLKNLEDLPNAINQSLHKKVMESDVYKFVKLVEKNSFECDFLGLDQITHNYFYRGGFTAGRKISISTMMKYLNDNKEIFNLLADEHIKKIYEDKNENASR